MRPAEEKEENMKRLQKLIILLPVILTMPLYLSCESDEEGAGTLTVETWGEEYIEEGIPEDEFSDGWSVTFDKFLVNIGGIIVAQGEGTPAITENTFKIYDLTRQGPTEIAIREVSTGRYNNTNYSISPADASTEIGNAALDDLDIMKNNGYSVYVEGRAEKTGENTKTFTWGFSTDTHYHGCESAADVSDGGTAVIQLTIHGDHLFYDDLFSAEPNVSFDIPAQADADSNDEISKEELRGFDISTLANYQVGSTGIDNLWEYISYLTKTLGHIDGEGHCHTD